MRVEVSVEHRRKCGHRKVDKNGVGIYLVGPAFSEVCERLPYYVHPCHECGYAFKHHRGWSEVNSAMRFKNDPCGHDKDPEGHHARCPICSPEIAGERAMVVFVGDKFYSPIEFAEEAMRMGVSRKVPNLPDWFEVGKTWVYLAHKAAVEREDVDKETGEISKVFLPGLIGCFRPVQIDLVVDDLERVPKRAERIAERFGDENCRAVKVFPYEGEQESLTTDPEGSKTEEEV